MRRRQFTRPTEGKVNAKLVGISVQSNYNNAAANRLVVGPDTTDVAGFGTGAVPIRDVADADGTAFVRRPGEGTNEVADVSIIEAISKVWSYA
jgi:hypothetical protein